MRIAFYVNHLEFFFSHRGYLIDFLSDRRCHIDLFAGRSKSQSMAIQTELISSRYLSIHRTYSKKFSSFILDELIALIDIFLYTRRCKPDIVHALGLKQIFLIMLIRRIHGNSARLVLSFTGLGNLFVDHRSRFFENTLKSIARFALVKLFKSLSHDRDIYAIVQNDEDYKYVANTLKVRASNIRRTFGAGFDPDCYPAPIVRDVPASPVIIVYCGRCVEEKGFYEFCEAAMILHKRNLGFRFVAIGALDYGKPYDVHNECRKRGIKLHVELVGHLDRCGVGDWLNQSSLVCLPSYREGFPLALVEAAFFGRPVVTTSVPGCSDFVRYSQAGITVPSRDSRKLANAIQKVVTDKTLYSVLTKKGRNWVSSHALVDEVINVHNEVYGL